MKFTKLRIAGFKTFVEPTDLHIEDGLTGVVGPNGCGKSNLVEAMRWVMGESSYKAMRAGGMEEVIFSGSGKRPARNSAEVKLFLDNTLRKAPAAFNEHEQLEVSRKIERDKGSNYRVNGRESRARDVQLMFADAASGARSPSMVRQGQIGEIISAKPVQRRALLEEAAGISGLHTRRHEAELRLKAAEANIERLDDVIGELDRQLDGLRRQARQAARFRDVAAKLRTAEAGVFALKWSAANQAANDAANALREAEALLKQADEGQLSAATAQASAAASVPDARNKAAEHGAALGRIVRARDELAVEEKRIAERLETARAQLNTLDTDIAREARLSDDHASERTVLEAELSTIKAADHASKEQVPAVENAAQEAEAVLAQALEASNAARDALAGARANIEAQARILQQAQAECARVESQQASAAQALTQLQSQTGASKRLEEARQKVAALQAARDETTQKVASSEAARTEALAAVASAETPLRAKEKELATLQAEVAALEKLVGQSDDVSADAYPPIMDAIDVQPGLEAAVGAALGEALEAASDPAAAQFWTHVDAKSADPTLPSGIEPLLDHIKAPPILTRGLAQIGLVDKADGAARQGQLAAGQILVSREGHVWRWDGFVRKADAPSAAAIKLAERNRLSGLVEQVSSLSGAVQTLSLAHMAALTAMQDADRAWTTHRNDEQQARRAYDEASSGLMALEREAEREGARLAAAQAEVDRLNQALTEAQGKQLAAQAAAPDTQTLTGLEADLAKARDDEAQARRARDEAAAARDQLRRELADHARRQEATTRAIEAWQRRADAAASHAHTLAKRRTGLVETLEKLDGEPGRLVEKRRSLASSLATAEEERSKAADNLARLEANQREADTKARQIKEAYFAAREAHGRAEERKAAADERRSALQAMIMEAVDAAPHELMAMAGFEPGTQPPALDVLERQLGELREARQRLGAVNLAAEQEAEEVAERRDTLTLERDDVAEAITKLRGTISTLNREGRVKLLEAFDRVNNQFQELFKKLFGGGEAELTLIDADDPLDAGLDIIAKPPGKKPQSITLLSGGEQALTAMALIFAVFLSNPAPICILDEVDAPLDDANVERFCDLLDDMGKRTSTRFLVVTHNPITMSRMHRLFGVTMAERGVSQIVSVALAEAEALVEAESAA